MHVCSVPEREMGWMDGASGDRQVGLSQIRHGQLVCPD